MPDSISEEKVARISKEKLNHVFQEMNGGKKKEEKAQKLDGILNFQKRDRQNLKDEIPFKSYSLEMKRKLMKRFLNLKAQI